ncbi:MAG: alpha/beta fold hydrolase [Alphaproteobacteria bacterium]|nr:alpha/beta fold hydrolase [Alphaproteobacteria bacterium]
MKEKHLEEGSVQEFHQNNATYAFQATPQNALEEIRKNPDRPIVIWAHGWRMSHKTWDKFIEVLEGRAHHIALDFPGFGNTPPPPDHWGTQDYAEGVVNWMTQENLPAVIWIGHSFGCRVGAQIAARHPDKIKAMAFIAGAGLKKKFPLWKKTYFYVRIRLFKALRHLLPDGDLKKKIMDYFGSPDYNAAGALRKVFVRVVNEDLSNLAKQISCPVTLVYGSDDQETPPDFGERYKNFMQNADLHILLGQDHYSLIQNGRHPVIKILNDFIKQVIDADKNAA